MSARSPKPCVKIRLSCSRAVSSPLWAELLADCGGLTQRGDYLGELRLVAGPSCLGNVEMGAQMGEDFVLGCLVQRLDRSHTILRVGRFGVYLGRARVTASTTWLTCVSRAWARCSYSSAGRPSANGHRSSTVARTGMT